MLHIKLKGVQGTLCDIHNVAKQNGSLQHLGPCAHFMKNTVKITHQTLCFVTAQKPVGLKQRRDLHCPCAGIGTHYLHVGGQGSTSLFISDMYMPHFQSLRGLPNVVYNYG